MKSFVVLALTREDIAYAMGLASLSFSQLSDGQMGRIASKTSDALYGLELWDIVAMVVEEILEED